MTTKGKSKSKNGKTVEEQYKKLTQHEHVLKRYDMYIGGIKNIEEEMHVFDDELERIVKKEIDYNPGLYKIIDEIIVNSRDHYIRDKTCNEIRVKVDESTNTISVYNNGNGIPVQIHKEHNVYVPELIFGHLLSGGNFDDDEKKIVGGKFGIGSKVSNIFSKKFIIETVDKNTKKKYRQVFENNMYKKSEPEIENVSKGVEPYTSITFTPDLERFNLDSISEGMLQLIKKRVYDLAACTGDDMTVYYNDKKINVKTFEDYIKLFYENGKLPSDLIYDEFNERWKVGILYDTLVGHQHVSFVNGINTYKGGNHVKHVMDQIIDKLTAYMKKKNKALNIKPQYVRENITIFLDAVIEDPTFDSQTKECLNKKISEFGSRCELDKKFIDRIIKTGICDEIMRTAESKENIALNKGGGNKSDSVRNIPKLEDAEEAGKRKSKLCSLILTEGDSALTFAIDGISHVGNKYYGAFPLRGKLLNVREATPKEITKNAEIQNIMKIMGLKIKTDKAGNILKSNVDINKLRYGRIIILTDSDVDGSHIKGLLMNFIHHFWPSLLKHDGFIQAIITPIIKVFKGPKDKQQVKCFDTIGGFKHWRDTENPKGWTVKYYKGLGTSTKQDAIEIFSELDRRRINYVWDLNGIVDDIESDKKDTDKNSDSDSDTEKDSETNSEKDSEKSKGKSNEKESDKDTENPSYQAIDLAFNKHKADLRKEWLQKYDEEDVINYDKETKVTYKDFIDRDLIHFSNYDVQRSIPAIDGFKPSQRKILYGCNTNKKMRTGEIKVSQLGGYVSESTEYHHGEDSLFGTIIKMAQDFSGSNNINLLKPNGNFGSYNAKGKDAAAPRYIFTEINQITHKLFRKEDNKILDHVFEDNAKVEPKLYCPIVPTILINGTRGIGTGYSTNIPKYNPIDICENIKLLLQEKRQKVLKPWYRGFEGEISEDSPGKYKTTGIFISNDNSVTIKELPIGMSTQEYKLHLDKMIIDKKAPKSTQFLTHYKSIPDNDRVNITVFFYSNNLQQFIKKGLLVQKLKLESNISTHNMWLYNTEGKLQKYNTSEEIISDYYDYRYLMYEKRKKYHTKLLENKKDFLHYKKLFIEMYLNDKIKINKNTTEENLIEQLETLKFPRLSQHIDDNNDDDDDNDKNDTGSYDYLTGMKILSLTKNKINDLEKELDKITSELNDYKSITIEVLWEREIDEFLEAYEKYLKEMKEKSASPIKKTKVKAKAKSKTSKK